MTSHQKQYKKQDLYFSRKFADMYQSLSWFAIEEQSWEKHILISDVVIKGREFLKIWHYLYVLKDNFSKIKKCD